jgi:hypothetical protein
MVIRRHNHTLHLRLHYPMYPGRLKLLWRTFTLQALLPPYIPVWWKWMYHISPFQHVFNTLLDVEFSGKVERCSLTLSNPR